MVPTRPLCAALLCLALPGLVLADARADLHAAFAKNLALKSYRATMTDLRTGKIVSTVEFQAPDRYRISVPGGPTSVIVGGNMYVDVNGQAMKLPLPAGTLDKFRSDTAWRRMEANTRFTDAGLGTVGAEPARKYHWVGAGKDASSGDTWVSAKSGHVLQVETSAQANGMRVRYSDFDSPAISISAPR